MAVSKLFYVNSVIIGIGAGYLLTISGNILTETQHQNLAGVLLVLGGIVGIYLGIVTLMLVYDMWSSIQDGHATITPGKAIVFLFIPFYNLYWLFKVFWGFSKDFNRYRTRNNLDAPKLPEGLFLAFSIMSLIVAFPFGILIRLFYNFGIYNVQPLMAVEAILQLTTVITLPFITVVMVSKTCDAINTVPNVSLTEHLT